MARKGRKRRTTRRDSTAMRRYLFWTAILGALLLIGGVWLFLVFPTEAVGPVPCGEISVALAYPRYLAPGDEGYLDVTACNRVTGTISGTLVVTFDQEIPVRLAEGTESRMVLEDLPPNACRTHRLRFVRREPARLVGGGDRSVHLYLIWRGASPQVCPRGDGWAIRGLPVYGLRSILRGMAGLPAVGMLPFVWELFREWAGYGEKGRKG